MTGETQGFPFHQFPRISPTELASLCGIRIERARALLRGAVPTEQEGKDIRRALLAWQDAHEADETPWIWEEEE